MSKQEAAQDVLSASEREQESSLGIGTPISLEIGPVNNFKFVEDRNSVRDMRDTLHEIKYINTT